MFWVNNKTGYCEGLIRNAHAQSTDRHQFPGSEDEDEEASLPPFFWQFQGSPPNTHHTSNTQNEPTKHFDTVVFVVPRVTHSADFRFLRLCKESGRRMEQPGSDPAVSLWAMRVGEHLGKATGLFSVSVLVLAAVLGYFFHDPDPDQFSR